MSGPRKVADLARLGERPLLLVLDYDGTLAPIAERPEQASPEPGAVDALTRLLEGGRHHVALLSGRKRDDVLTLLEFDRVPVVGLHGMEWPGMEARPPQRDVIEGLLERLPEYPGRLIEDKNHTIAVHYRQAPEAQRAQIEAALDGMELPDGWEMVAGKMVREYRPGGFGKGRAIERLAREYPQHLPVFIGDDITDEEGFEAVLRLGGVAVKVGPGDTVAKERLDGPRDVVNLLSAWA